MHELTGKNALYARHKLKTVHGHNIKGRDHKARLDLHSCSDLPRAAAGHPSKDHVYQKDDAHRCNSDQKRGLFIIGFDELVDYEVKAVLGSVNNQIYHRFGQAPQSEQNCTCPVCDKRMLMLSQFCLHSIPFVSTAAASSAASVRQLPVSRFPTATSFCGTTGSDRQRS